jgi:hypothetical protein
MANIEIRDRMKRFLPETRKRVDIDQGECVLLVVSSVLLCISVLCTSTRPKSILRHKIRTLT